MLGKLTPKSSIRLNPDWLVHLQNEFESDYMKNLSSFLKTEINRGKIIYPHGHHIFNAFDTTPFSHTKVVIIGQDPYHGPGQAHGMCFSVPMGIPTPPSLLNIFQELQNDLGITPPKHGHLEKWAKQGVLLLNAVLTVEKAKASSHQGRGWETFTDRVIDILNEKKEGLVFLLWGSFAQKKGNQIDKNRHLVLSASHPSPLSAYRGFFGCRHFSKTNSYLLAKGFSPIDWNLPPV